MIYLRPFLCIDVLGRVFIGVLQYYLGIYGEARTAVQSTGAITAATMGGNNNVSFHQDLFAHTTQPRT